MKDFLNSKSMLTPGIAGAVTMLITNTLIQQFELPGRWVALGLSFVLGTLVFSDRTTVIWQRGILYLLNSLIIFSMAVGTNTAGRSSLESQARIQSFHGETEVVSEPQFFKSWFGG
jgi:hypothetical protein